MIESSTYFITFTTYGTRLHGDERGTVDRNNNRNGDEFIPSDEQLKLEKYSRMDQEPYLLDSNRRAIVLEAICQHSAFRNWSLHAIHVRTNHIHVVITANKSPERVMEECKAYASRALNLAGLDIPSRKRWTRHGSTKHLFTDDSIRDKVRYTIFEQGELFSLFVSPEFAT